ncbi:MAG: (d)CMP kinase [Planctomycetota bacterium]
MSQAQDNQDLVVAIDGPSGSGKSTVARALATELGYAYLDTGAMYRAVTWYLLRRQVAETASDEELEAELRQLDMCPTRDGRVLLCGEDVTSHLRSREVESKVSAVSARPVVRRAMRKHQRQFATSGPIVAEGRDVASVVFPKARWKFFIDAEPEERARRRCQDFRASGRVVSEAQVLQEMVARDRLDSTRKDAPLARIKDATYVDTTGQDIKAVVARLREIVTADG